MIHAAQSLKLHAEPELCHWQQSYHEDTAETGVIATGHQPIFFHPGILSKYFAASAFKKHLVRASILRNWVVDQDVLDPFAIEVPNLVLREIDQNSDQHPLGHVSVTQISLNLETARHAKQLIPSGMQPPIEPETLLQAIDQQCESECIARHLAVLRSAIQQSDSQSFHSLAEQVIHLRELLLPASLRDQFQHIYATRLFEAEDANGILDRMLNEPALAVSTYNQAVRQVTGLSSLSQTDSSYELPLWACQWMQPRQRIYARIEDGLIRYQVRGETYDRDGLKGNFVIAPRALCLTGLVRLFEANLFIHGLGGGIYETATEKWLQAWLGEASRTMCPKAVVSCDLYLDQEFAACQPDCIIPTASQTEYEKSIWYVQHLKHNLDRVLLKNASQLSQHQQQEVMTLHQHKKALLNRIDETRDRQVRSIAFQQIHVLNKELCTRYGHVLRDANRLKQQKRLGRLNAEAARKRDWPFFLYDAGKLQSLYATIETHMSLTKVH